MVSRAYEGRGRSNQKGEEEENTSHGDDDVVCDVRLDSGATSTCSSCVFKYQRRKSTTLLCSSIWRSLSSISGYSSVESSGLMSHISQISRFFLCSLAPRKMKNEPSP
jgi:hypothetical protein